ncbi:hypothetical protein GCM10010360_12580 [Streptomyces nogalater]
MVGIRFTAVISFGGTGGGGPVPAFFRPAPGAQGLSVSGDLSCHRPEAAGPAETEEGVGAAAPEREPE